MIDRVFVSHRGVTPRADGAKVMELEIASLGFWDVMAYLEVKDGDFVCTPGYRTLGFIAVFIIRSPHLLP